MDAKFIKAQASNGDYYGLKVEKVGISWKVTDFYAIDKETAKKLASTIDVDDLETASNLLACPRCGSRRVGGCTCYCEKMRQESGYRFPYIYSRDLRVFKKAEGSELVSSDQIGKSVVLEQGQEVIISAAGASALEHILVGVRWDEAQNGRDMDVDSSVIIKKDSQTEIVYFGNLMDVNKSVLHRGDNLYGGSSKGCEGGDSENIDLYLRKASPDTSEMYIVLNIYGARERKQTLQNVRNMSVRILDAGTNHMLASYKLERGMNNQTGLILGKVYRSGGSWLFKAIGEGADVANIRELAERVDRM